MKSEMQSIVIEHGRVLGGKELVETKVTIANGNIEALEAGTAADLNLDARGLLVLPGIVDIHGDAFERQMMPRPGVDFPVDIALPTATGRRSRTASPPCSTARPGRGSPACAAPRMPAPRRRHGAARPGSPPNALSLRHETYNLEAEASTGWLAGGRIDLLAFNDHMGSTVELNKPQKREMVKRPACDAEFDKLVERTSGAATKCRLHGAPRRCRARARHPDAVARRQQPGAAPLVPSLGSGVSRVPHQRRDRAGSRTPATTSCSARPMWCAAAATPAGPRRRTWSSAGCARSSLRTITTRRNCSPRSGSRGRHRAAAARVAADLGARRGRGLNDRGRIAAGYRADIILVDTEHQPRVVATIAAGKIVHLTEGHRLLASN